MNAATDLKFPFSIEPVDPLLNTQLLRDFKGMYVLDRNFLQKNPIRI